MLDEPNRKPNKIWVDKGSEFYNRLMKSWLQDNDIDIQHIMKENLLYMNSVSKNRYIDELDDIVNKHNDTYHTTIKLKPVDVNSSTYIHTGVENNEKNPKFEIVDHVKISTYKNLFEKGYTPNWSEEVFVAKKVKYTVS